MARARKIKGKTGASYQLIAYTGYGPDGKQLTRTRTWKPPAGMSDKKAEKQATIEAAKFEDQISKGIAPVDSKIKLAEYAAIWFDGLQVAHETREQYRHMLTRITIALGGIRLEALQPHHIQAFYKNLAEAGIKGKPRYVSNTTFVSVLEEKQLSRAKLAQMAGVAPAVARAASNGHRIAAESAQKIAHALGRPIGELFTMQESKEGLSDKTIKHHHAVLSAMLNAAKRQRIIIHSPLEFMDAPKIKRKEARYLDDEQARRLVALLMDESDIRVKTSIMLALYSGVRRGELCGLSWGDIDEKRGVIHILRASQYQRGMGVVEVGTKNESSMRAIKLPGIMFDVLREYRVWWLGRRLINGDKWQGQLERVFIRDNGLPLSPDTVNFWLSRFIEKHDLEHFTPHSLRHTFTSLQIAAGVDIKSLQQRTGHSLPSTLLNTYTHAFKSANEAAADALDDILTPRVQKKPEFQRANA